MYSVQRNKDYDLWSMLSEMRYGSIALKRRLGFEVSLDSSVHESEIAYGEKGSFENGRHEPMVSMT